MSGTRSLLHWFSSRRNQQIKEKILEHITVVKSVCEISIQLYDSLLKGDKQSVIDKITSIDNMENKADMLQDELADIISKGFLSPNIQENLFRIVRRVDETANWIKTASKDIHLIIELDLLLPNGIFELQKQICVLTSNSVSTVIEMIETLGIDDQTVIDKRIEVEKFEREADEIYYKAKEEALKLGLEANSSTVFLALDTAKSLENSSDACSEAADWLYSIVIGSSLVQ